MNPLLVQIAVWGAGKLVERFGPALALWLVCQLPPVRRLQAAGRRARP